MDITFVHPIYLWFLVSIPLLVATYFTFSHYTRRKAIMFANFEALKRVTGKNMLTTNIFELLLRAFILVALIFAAAGTTFWYDGTALDNDFVIAIDVSASMSAQDITETRLDAAKNIANELVDTFHSKSNIGVVSFSSVSLIQQLPTKDSSLLKESINNLDVEKSGGTDITGALITGTNILSSSERGKSIILITDGSNTYDAFTEDSVGRGIDYAVSRQVIVHTIGIGRNSGPIGYLPEYYNITASFNEDLLIRIAEDTGGDYFIARDDEALKEVVDYMLERTEKSKIPVDISFGALLIAIMLLFVEWGLANTRFRKIP